VLVDAGRAGLNTWREAEGASSAWRNPVREPGCGGAVPGSEGHKACTLWAARGLQNGGTGWSQVSSTPLCFRSTGGACMHSVGLQFVAARVAAALDLACGSHWVQRHGMGKVRPNSYVSYGE
jgi:hypothetical protein